MTQIFLANIYLYMCKISGPDKASLSGQKYLGKINGFEEMDSDLLKIM